MILAKKIFVFIVEVAVENLIVDRSIQCTGAQVNHFIVS